MAIVPVRDSPGFLSALRDSKPEAEQPRLNNLSAPMSAPSIRRIGIGMRSLIASRSVADGKRFFRGLGRSRHGARSERQMGLGGNG